MKAPPGSCTWNHDQSRSRNPTSKREQTRTSASRLRRISSCTSVPQKTADDTACCTPSYQVARRRWRHATVSDVCTTDVGEIRDGKRSPVSSWIDPCESLSRAGSLFRRVAEETLETAPAKSLHSTVAPLSTAGFLAARTATDRGARERLPEPGPPRLLSQKAQWALSLIWRVLQELGKKQEKKEATTCRIEQLARLQTDHDLGASSKKHSGSEHQLRPRERPTRRGGRPQSPGEV